MPETQRFLLMKSGFQVSILFLDRHGSCDHSDSDGNLFHRRYHPYRDEKGQHQVLLCPNGLESNEWQRVFPDDPPGSWIKAFASYREGPPKRQKIAEEE